MGTRLRAIGTLLLLPMAGCLPLKDDPLPTVKPTPLGAGGPVVGQSRQLSPASKEEALRVDIVGQKLLQANRETGLRPVFQTIGSETPELFHRGTDSLIITEGLSRQCKTEGQLAALLAYELGRMVAEREAMASPAVRQPERLPPMRSGVGADSGGVFGPADGTQLVELARHDRERPRAKAAPAPPPDPRVLARTYLQKSGYDAKEFDAVAVLLRQARNNNEYESQLRIGAAVRPGPQ